MPAKLQAHPELVIALHGSMGTGERARRVYGYDFDLLAEEHGFIAVYPQGYDGYWNDCKVKGSENLLIRPEGEPVSMLLMNGTADLITRGTAAT